MSRLGGDIQLWLALAYQVRQWCAQALPQAGLFAGCYGVDMPCCIYLQAVGRDADCIDLYKKVTIDMW